MPCSATAVDQNGDVLLNAVVAELLPEAEVLGVSGDITCFKTVCDVLTSVGGPTAIVVTHHELTAGVDRCGVALLVALAFVASCSGDAPLIQ